MASPPITLGVLVSGSGSSLQNLIDQIHAGKLNARIGVVIGSKPDLLGVKRAADAKLAHAVVDHRQFPECAAFSNEVFNIIDDAGVDLVCLAGWLCLIEIPWRYENRIMNIHPALLPSFGGKGMYGKRVHQAVIEHGCKVSGCTVHFVNEEYDGGPIILQRACAVSEGDTPDTLAQRVFEEEKIAYPQAIGLFAQGRLSLAGRRVHIRG
jgi:formyltetrahydrofolate-dependent phosphoribosylglycinamide formyltransferase